MTRTRHTCHARRCDVEVAPSLFMCHRHWFQIPQRLRREVWKHYRPGQELDKRPTRAYLDAADAAIKAVAEIETQRRLKAEAKAKRQGRLFQ